MVGTVLMIDKVKSSILQCFCRACHARVVEKPHPSLSTQMITNMQPKKMVYLATEVRASEQSKGGMKYELVLADPSDVAPPRFASTPPKSNISVEDIENKLRAAEERRQYLEAHKLNQLNEKRFREQEALLKKREYNANFVQSAKENLEQKMESNKENREAFIKSIQEKSREQDKHILDVRKQLDEQADQLRDRLQRKLEIAQENRENLSKVLQDKLQEHDRHAEEVRLNKAQNVTGIASG
ncbi:stathmin-like [Limulus polyphemus]|uniref:Stathmin-like n=1 Tax=Limulus polyphemus TaxID=6850 RepID=A0ABM1TCV0_LIMPO|nr:stathmin-like [Limulus polyphemus]